MAGERYAYRTLTVSMLDTRAEPRRTAGGFHVVDSDSGTQDQDVEDPAAFVRILTQLGDKGWRLRQYLSSDVGRWPVGVHVLEHMK